MKMKTKTCANCGNKVDMASKFCPKCGNSEFRQTAVVVKEDNPTLVHKLFYWNYDGYYMLSKSKLAGIASFLGFASMVFLAGAPISMFLFGAIIGALVFLLGIGLHNLVSKPSKAKLEYNDYGFITDLKHFLLFWQDKKTGQYVLSKTKVISHLVFMLFAIIASFMPLGLNVFSIILFGLFFEVPAFLIGTGVHKITKPFTPQPEREISRPKQIPKSKPVVEKPIDAPVDVELYSGYKNQIERLVEEYNVKEKHTRDLIAKRFEPPQLTYTRFIGVVDKSTQMFTHQADSALTMINLANEYSVKIEEEIKSKISIMKDITSKLDDLTNELVLTIDKSDDEDINNLFDDMSNLIKSVSDYD